VVDRTDNILLFYEKDCVCGSDPKFAAENSFAEYVLCDTWGSHVRSLTTHDVFAGVCVSPVLQPR
jgi:hypothetical protein